MHPFRLRYVGLPLPARGSTPAIEPGDTFGADSDGQLLGRGARDELLPTRLVALRKIRVVPDPVGYRVEDRGSKRGITIGGVPTARTLARPGDALVLDGDLPFEVEAGVEEPRATRQRTFVFGDHTLTIRTDDDRWWIALLDGRPAALRQRRTRSTVTNSGVAETVVEDFREVMTAALGVFATGEPYPGKHANGTRSLSVHGIGADSGSVYNTVVYSARSASLVFTFDSRVVELTWREQVDVST